MLQIKNIFKVQGKTAFIVINITSAKKLKSFLSFRI